MREAVAAVGVVLLAVGGCAAAAAEPADTEASIRTLIDEGSLDRAEAGAREWIARLDAEGRGESLDAASALDLLVESLLRAGKATAPETRELAERAVGIREAHPDDERRARSLMNLGFVFHHSRDPDGARPLYEQAYAVARRHLAPDDPGLYGYAMLLGNVLVELGDYAEAGRVFGEALVLRERQLGAEDPGLARDLYNVANVAVLQGRYDEAEVLYRRILDLTGIPPVQHAWYLDGYAGLLYQVGDFPGSRTYYERSLEIRERELEPDALEIASTLNNLAVLERDMGDYTAALAHFRRALEIREKRLEPEDPMLAQSLHNLAVTQTGIGRTDEAVALLERALSIAESAWGRDDPRVTSTLLNYADALVAKSRLDRAESLYERALAVWENTLGPGHEDVGLALKALGSISERNGDHAAAAERFGRATSILSAHLGHDHPLTAEARSHLASALLNTGRPDQAMSAALDAERAFRDHLISTARTLSERQALAYAALRSEGLDVVLSVSAGRVEDPGAAREALDALIRSRALVMDEMAARRQAVSGSEDPEIERLTRELQSARSRLAGITLLGADAERPDLYLRRLEQARTRRDEAERTLATRSAAFRDEQRVAAAGLAEVERALPEGSVLVSFARYDHRAGRAGGADTRAPEPEARYAAWVLRADASRAVPVSLGPATAVESRIRSWRAALAPTAPNAEPAYRSRGQELREQVWAPIEPHLEGADIVFVVPDGELHLVSLGALPDGSSRYLVESGPSIHHLSAERDLTASDETSGRGLFIVGDPAFDDAGSLAVSRAAANDPVGVTRGEGSACVRFREHRFERLPASSAEAQRIEALWTESNPDAPVTRLVRGDAREDAVKSRVSGHRVIHLATHGFFLADECRTWVEGMRGIGGLSPAARPVLPPADLESPLALTGLALAGANARSEAPADGEDGILTAEEIAGLDLEGVEWAVLSACDTGIGEVRSGEGVLGLHRAFRVAGAATVIMSLWPVEDESARSFMEALYSARLDEGKSTAESVRSASLSTLRQRRDEGLSTHPFFWGGWIAAGAWE